MREVTHAAEGPRRVTVDDIDDQHGDIAVCLCGLSDEYPFCDGAHKRTEDERPETRYKYVDGERRRVAFVYVSDDSAAPPTGDESGVE